MEIIGDIRAEGLIVYEGVDVPHYLQPQGLQPLRPTVSRDIFSQRRDWEQRKPGPCLRNRLPAPGLFLIVKTGISNENLKVEGGRG